MKKKILKKKGIQKENLREVSLKKIEAQLTSSLLKGILALHLLKNSKKPVSILVDELFDLEAEVGRFIAAAYRASAKDIEAHNIKGALSMVLSLIPFATMPQPKQSRKKSLTS